MRDSEVDGEAVQALVVAARAGDRSALAELVQAHLPLVYNLVGRALAGRPDVDDVVQECMLRVIRGLPQLRQADRFRSWLVSITYRQLREYWRGLPDELPLHRHDEEIPDAGGDLAERTTAEVVLDGQRRDLVTASRWLDAEERSLFALWWQELTGKISRAEVVAALGVTGPTAAVRLHRLRGQLDALRGVVTALQGGNRCPDLSGLARTWDGEVSALWRKRFIRHVRDCQVCARHGDGLVPPEHLVLGVAALPVSAAALAAARAAAEGSAVTPVASTLGQAAVASTHGRWQSPSQVSTAAAIVVGVAALAVWLVPAEPEEESVVWVPTPPGPAVTTSSIPPTAATATPSAGATPATARPPAATIGVSSADIFVATNGSDAGDGSIARPFATLNRAVEVVRPGQTIAVRGGTYRLTRPVEITTNGTEDRRIVLSAYRDERAVLDAGAVPDDEWTVTQQTRFWTVQDLQVQGSRSHAWVCRACAYTTFQRMSMHDNARSGLLLRDPGTVGNQVLDSDFFRNHEPGENGSVGIGLGVKFGAGAGNLVRGNRAFHNADDGFDFGAFDSPITIERNWAFGNGQNRWAVPDWASNGYGFSLGGGPETTRSDHRLRHNAAWGNRGHGFGAEANRGRLTLTRNTAFDNGGAGFDLLGNGTARANLEIDNERTANVGAGVASEGNSWDAGRWTRATFRSTDATTAEGDRPPDGTLPATDYLSTRENIGADLAAS